MICEFNDSFLIKKFCFLPSLILFRSTVCSNICQLPNGYSSRCEQKYVQKRLIALNADGTNLYTDTFWFPSCCACTIAGPT